LLKGKSSNKVLCYIKKKRKKTGENIREFSVNKVCATWGKLVIGQI
jgi:hypothetical protein